MLKGNGRVMDVSRELSEEGEKGARGCQKGT